jgi:hypothetical protein
MACIEKFITLIAIITIYLTLISNLSLDFSTTKPINSGVNIMGLLFISFLLIYMYIHSFLKILFSWIWVLSPPNIDTENTPEASSTNDRKNSNYLIDLDIKGLFVIGVTTIIFAILFIILPIKMAILLSPTEFCAIKNLPEKLFNEYCSKQH